MFSGKIEDYILFEDKEIIVCRKPAGIAVQNARIGAMDLESSLKNYLAMQDGGGRRIPYLAVIHRLDQPVEGILVFGKTPEAAKSLSAQITAGKMEKIYLAVTYGKQAEAGKKEKVLEDYLKKWKGSLIMVTHDRYFLDSVSNRIVEIDKGNIYSYDTNYSGFLERKAMREESEIAGERKRQSVLRKEIEWIKRGAKARSTKQKARIQRYETLRDQPAPDVDKKIEISSISTRMGKTTVELSHLHKAYGDRVLIQDFSYIFLKNDRIGFVGKNGCGKTTLMKMIEGRQKPDSGEVILGQTIKLGYYSQEIEEKKEAGIAYMDPSMRVIDYIKNTAEFVRTEDGLISASAMLERFLFPPEEQYSVIGKLSGGEKRRLNLLRVLMEAPNVLILDEPTNDLDIVTLSILEDYLDNYDGIVITVSHDRYFLDRVVRRIFAFEENGVLRQYEGGYTDYVNRKREEEKDREPQIQTEKESTAKPAAKDTRTHAPKLKFSYKEQREYETIETDIAALEERMDEIDEEIAKCATDFVRLNELTEEKTKVNTELEEKLERWEYLEELAAKIEAQKNGKNS